MVDRFGCWKLERSLSFVDLLEICLEEPARYTATKHHFKMSESEYSELEVFTITGRESTQHTHNTYNHLLTPTPTSTSLFQGPTTMNV